MPPALIRSRKPWRPSALRALHSLRAPPAPVRESCPLRPPCFGFSLRKPTRNSLILRGAQWHKARPCASERSSDCFGGARFRLPNRAQLGLFFLRASASSRFPIHSTTTPSRHGLCASSALYIAIPEFLVVFHKFHATLDNCVTVACCAADMAAIATRP